MGSAEKKPTDSELKTRAALQKCLVAIKPIRKGEIISADSIVAKRTGGVGISPVRYKTIVGTVASKDFFPDDIIE
jgi:sialic acid synthase SpsE